MTVDRNITTGNIYKRQYIHIYTLDFYMVKKAFFKFYDFVPATEAVNTYSRRLSVYWSIPIGPNWHVEVINRNPIFALKHQQWREPKVLAVRTTCMLCVWLFSSNLGLCIFELNLFLWLSVTYQLIVCGAELNQ